MADDSESLKDLLSDLTQMTQLMGMMEKRGPGAAVLARPVEQSMQDYTVGVVLCFKNLDQRVQALDRRINALERKLLKR